MLCSIQLGVGNNVFNNQGIFQSGAVVNLGGGSLISSGTLAVGDQGVVGKTFLFGNYVQTSSGVLQVEVDYQTNTADRLLTRGTAKVAGRVG